jgi:hypothetical protein
MCNQSRHVVYTVADQSASKARRKEGRSRRQASPPPGGGGGGGGGTGCSFSLRALAGGRAGGSVRS